MLAVIRGEKPIVYGDGEQTRDFTYVANVVDETLRACESKDASGMVFNGGTGIRITLNEVLKLLEKSPASPSRLSMIRRATATSAIRKPISRWPAKSWATSRWFSSRKV